jgi:hypothetical protein
MSPFINLLGTPKLVVLGCFTEKSPNPFVFSNQKNAVRFATTKSNKPFVAPTIISLNPSPFTSPTVI